MKHLYIIVLVLVSLSLPARADNYTRAKAYVKYYSPRLDDMFQTLRRKISVNEFGASFEDAEFDRILAYAKSATVEELATFNQPYLEQQKLDDYMVGFYRGYGQGMIVAKVEAIREGKPKDELLTTVVLGYEDKLKKLQAAKDLAEATMAERINAESDLAYSEGYDDKVQESKAEASRHRGFIKVVAFFVAIVLFVGFILWGFYNLWSTPQQTQATQEAI